MALARRKKPSVSDRPDRYLYISAIIAAMQRLEKLMCSNPTLRVELKNCLYSRDTLSSLTKSLISQDYDEYIKEMTRRDLDWRNPLGKETYKCFRYICVMEKNIWRLPEIMEALVPFKRCLPLLPMAVIHQQRANLREYLQLLI